MKVNNFNLRKICNNCKYCKWLNGKPHCWGQKNAPAVRWDSTCKDFEILEVVHITNERRKKHEI